MPIGEFCNREVIVADRNTSVLEAAQLMREYHVGCLVVVESLDGPRRPIGLVTDRDIVVEVVAENVAPETVKLGEIMTGKLSTICVTDGVYDTLRYMREHGFRRMPVVNELGELAGIVSMDDYLGLLAEEMTELTRLIAREQGRESTLRR